MPLLVKIIFGSKINEYIYHSGLYGWVHDNNGLFAICVFILVFVIVIVLAIIFFFQAAGLADEFIESGVDLGKEVWKKNNMNDKILHGIEKTYSAAHGAYKEIMTIMTADNIRKWLKSISVPYDNIVVIEVVSVSVKNYSVTCRVTDKNNNIVKEACWQCQEIDYELTRYVGSCNVRTILRG
jgi:hypothetical protein